MALNWVIGHKFSCNKEIWTLPIFVLTFSFNKIMKYAK